MLLEILRYILYASILPRMALQTTTTIHSRQYSLTTNMDSTGDKEDRKREVCLLHYLNTARLIKF